jgi:hypothetical protein
VDVNPERSPGGLPSPFSHASNAHAAERLTALIDEDVWRRRRVSKLLTRDEAQRIAVNIAKRQGHKGRHSAGRLGGRL